MQNKKFIAEYRIIKYSQFSQEYITAVLPFEIIQRLSHVLIYGEDDYGYQRKLIPSHLKKIKKYIEENNEFLFPTSIILAVDKKDIEKRLKVKNNFHFLDLDFKKEEKIFRIVDGQHRIEALKEVIKTNKELRYYNFNVVILITTPHTRLVELQVFTDINSKSKRIKVDLAELAVFNYELLDNKIKDLSQHISIRTAYLLNENFKGSVWMNSIKLDIHSDVVIGSVGVNAFRESIKTIVDFYIKEHSYEKIKNKGTLMIKYANVAANKISEFVNEAWMKSVKSKWSNTFNRNFILDENEEAVQIYYDNDYYIQKTIGVKSLNYLLGDIVKEKGITSNALREFNQIIKDSKIISKDWQTGSDSIFSGLSSESGFNKAKKLIANIEKVKRF